MTWDNIWEEIFKKQPWGKYPSEPLIRLIAKNFYQVPNRSDIKILEVGSGPGANLWYCAREGFTVFGIEGSETALKLAKARLDNEVKNWKGSLKIGDICQMDFQDNFFDCVIDIECLYCLKKKDLNLAIKEIYRVLKPGGIFISRAFGKSTIGFETGEKIEENTFICDVGPLKGKGISRFIDLDDIERFYPEKYFVTKSVESTSYTLNNRKHTVQEWMIEKSKVFEK